jgi:hypothetical protein
MKRRTNGDFLTNFVAALPTAPFIRTQTKAPRIRFAAIALNHDLETYHDAPR